MVDCTTRDLVCLHLENHAEARERSPVPRAVSAAGIGDALEFGGAASDRVSLLKDLERLESEGLVTAEEREVAGHDAPRTVYFLTGEGREHAREVRERLADETVVVTDGTTAEVRLGDVGRYFDAAEDPLVTALARATDDDRVPLERHVGEGFVDRREELSALRGAIDESTTSGSRTVAVAGDPGMGKTALVGEAVERAREDEPDLAVATGDCPEGPDDPYAPLRRAFEDLPDGTGLADPLSGGREAVTPEDPERTESQRTALFNDLVDGVREFATERPLVLFLDNLQWADRATLDLFAHLATSVTEWVYPVTFVCAYRPAAAEADHHLSTVLERLEADTDFVGIDLEPLSRGDVRALLAGAVGSQRLPEGFVDVVFAQTGGVPLFVTETATHLLETGAVAPERDAFPTAVEDLAVPEAVAEGVEERLRHLDGPARDLLALGAVVGERIPRAVLAEASDLPPARRREYVDLLVASRVWERAPVDGNAAVPTTATAERAGADAASPGAPPAGAGTPDGPGASRDPSEGSATGRPTGGDLGFVSGAVREAVVDRIDEDEHRALHRRVAEALRAVHGDDADEHAAVVGYHYEGAGDYARAIDYYRRAGAGAVETYAHEVAVANYRQALLLGRREGAADDATLAAINRELAEVHLTTGEYGAAVDAAEEGLGHAPEASRERCRLLGVVSEAEHGRGEYDAAREAAEREEELARNLGDRDLVGRAVRRLGDVVRERGDYDAAVGHYERALADFEADGDRHGIATVRQRLGSVAERRGDYDAAQDHYEAALDAFEAVGDRAEVAGVYANLGKIAERLGEYDRAREHDERALSDFEAVGDRHGIATTHSNLGSVAQRQGDYDRARDHYEAALEGYRTIGARHDVGQANVDLGVVAQKCGEYDRAREHLERALAVYDELGDRHGIASARTNLGNVARERGDYDRAREQFERALAGYEAVGADHEIAMVDTNLGIVAHGRGDYERAVEHFEAALAGYEDVGDRHRAASTRINLGAAATERGEYDRAREHLERALEVHEELGDRHGIASIHTNLGDVARARGEYERARDHYEQALDVHEAVGDRHREAAVEASLGDVAREREEFERAREHYERALAGYEAVGDREGIAETTLARGRLALARGDAEVAAGRAREARETFEDLAATQLTARSRRLLGDVAAERGDRDGAGEHWEAALETFESVGAPQGALETLERLVESRREAGDDAAALEWCRRAEETVEEAPAAVADQHREWIERHRSYLAGE